jgi:hypothetical protein
MYVLRKAQKSVGRKKPSPQVVRLFESHPGLAGCCTSQIRGVTRGYKDGLQPKTLADGNWLVNLQIKPSVKTCDC